MRMVSMPTPGTRFSPNLEVVGKFLPEVRRIEIDFNRPTPDQLMDRLADLARSVTLDFKNETKLQVSGVYLWKFLDAIPPELGSDEYGWHAENHYSDLPTEFLMRSIRAAYAAMFEVKRPDDPNAVPPLTATIELGEKKMVDIVYPSELKAPLWDALWSLLAKQLPQAKDIFRRMLKARFDAALSAHRTKLEHYDRGDGMIGNRFVSEPWPGDVRETMTLGQFWKEQRQEEEVPWLTSIITYCIRDIETISLEATESVLIDLKNDNPELFKAIAEGWRMKYAPRKAFKTEVLREAMANSRDQEKITDHFWIYFFPKESENMLVKEYVGSA